MVEHDLAKVGVAGSSPVFRSKSPAAAGDFFSNLAKLVVPKAIGMAALHALRRDDPKKAKKID